MSILGKETKAVQNPALGAILLWRFVVGYAEGSRVNRPAPLPLLFIVLPIELHEETAQCVKSTQQRSGLRAFEGKFTGSSDPKNDLILAIHDRALRMRRLSMDSLKIAVASRLLSIDSTNGVVMPLSFTSPTANIPQSVRPLLSGAEKLGVWCSEISLHEVSVILKVAF